MGGRILRNGWPLSAEYAYWGIHNGIREEEARPERRQNRVYQQVPIDERMSVGDVACLFDGNQCLYGWGLIVQIGESYAVPNGMRRDISVAQNFLQYQLRRMNEILALDDFANFDRIQDENLSSFNVGQAQLLRGMFPPNAAPPDPAAVREQAMIRLNLRPVVTDFVQGERLRIEETRFDEFKEITTAHVVKTIRDTVNKYVVGFLNIHDLHGEELCRIFWGVRNDGVVVGFPADRDQRDEIRRELQTKLSGVEPRLGASAWQIRFHEVREGGGSVLEDVWVLELVVGRGEPNEFYCAQDGTFYIKQEGTNPALKGQRLLAEMRWRIKS
jgi:Schlafen, AlbA_2